MLTHLEECRVVGVQSACKHELLPHKQPQLVGNLIERVLLVDAAAPVAQRVEVRLFVRAKKIVQHRSVIGVMVQPCRIIL